MRHTNILLAEGSDHNIGDTMEVKVKAHKSHSKTGKVEHIRAHLMNPNPRVHARHVKRLNMEIEELKKRGKYAMGIDLATTYNHPGYSEKLSARANAKRGYKANHDWLRTARQLQLLANINSHHNFEASGKFKEAADYAFKRLRA